MVYLIVWNFGAGIIIVIYVVSGTIATTISNKSIMNDFVIFVCIYFVYILVLNYAGLMED